MLAGEGVGGPNSDEGTDTLVLQISLFDQAPTFIILITLRMIFLKNV
jgi:hypothetical protein